MHNYTSITASVAGASGYTGTELLRWLSRHPRVRLNNVYANTHAGMAVDSVIPSLARIVDKILLPIDRIANDESDVLFLALPHTEALTHVPSLEGTRKIIDLSGDFRLRDESQYLKYYGHAYSSAAPLGRAVYGLSEVNAHAIAPSSLVANPGCYATVATLALAPLATHQLLPEIVSIIAYSGVSGAGRAPSAGTHFVEVNESVTAYKIGVHQHTPEIEQALGDIGTVPVRVSFIPHLLPVTRGIHTTITIPRPHDYTYEQIVDLFKDYYQMAPFIRLCSAPPSMKDVANTNFCDIHVSFDAHADMIIILATIDNLVKGAAGQAVQNMNLMFGFPVTEGLLP